MVASYYQRGELLTVHARLVMVFLLCHKHLWSHLGRFKTNLRSFLILSLHSTLRCTYMRVIVQQCFDSVNLFVLRRELSSISLCIIVGCRCQTNTILIYSVGIFGMFGVFSYFYFSLTLVEIYGT